MVLAGESELLRGNLPRHRFVDHKSHLPDPGVNSGHHSGKPATNRFSYGAAHYLLLVSIILYMALQIIHCLIAQKAFSKYGPYMFPRKSDDIFSKKPVSSN
jgi:hypothetical protein